MTLVCVQNFQGPGRRWKLLNNSAFIKKKKVAAKRSTIEKDKVFGSIKGHDLWKTRREKVKDQVLECVIYNVKTWSG